MPKFDFSSSNKAMKIKDEGDDSSSESASSEDTFS